MKERGPKLYVCVCEESSGIVAPAGREKAECESGPATSTARKSLSQSIKRARTEGREAQAAANAAAPQAMAVRARSIR